MYPTQFLQIFGSASCVQQLIIPERLNQIYIVAHRWKEEILSFPTMCHSSKSVTCIKFKGSSYDGSLTCERKIAVGINTISPKGQHYFPFRNSFLLSRSPIVSFWLALYNTSFYIRTCQNCQGQPCLHPPCLI